MSGDSQRIDALTEQLASAWDDPAADELASHLTNRGGVFSNRGRLEEAMADLERAVEFFATLRLRRGEMQVASKLALALTNRGITLSKLGRVADGIVDFEEAMIIFTHLIEKDGRKELTSAFELAARNRQIALEHLKGKPMPPQDLNRPNYDPHAVQPFREELTRVGFRELLTPEDVDACLGELKGTALLVVNSVCGCAAGGARPGVVLALQHRVIPDHLVTVFAGMERAAVERARGYLKGYPPSSPSIALLKEDEVVAVLGRHDIEGQSPEMIAQALAAAFDRFCTRPGPSVPPEELAKLVPQQTCGSQIPPFPGG